jgi:hypothetical protein
VTVLRLLWVRECAIVTDVDRYVIIRELFHHAGGKFKHAYTKLFSREVACRRYDVPGSWSECTSAVKKFCSLY